MTARRDPLCPLQQPVISAPQGTQPSHRCSARAGKMLCSSSLLVQAQQAARFILQASHSALSNLITRCWALCSRFLSTYKMKARNHITSLLQATWTTCFVAVCCVSRVRWLQKDADFKVAGLHLALNEANSEEKLYPVVYWHLSHFGAWLSRLHEPRSLESNSLM